MNLSTIITNIKNKINTIPIYKPVFIYIGIGTYAGLKNNNGILEPKNYHQYPPFLQHLMNSIPELNLYIVLVDPIQEQPPYMVLDKNLTLLHDDNNNIDNNIYTSNDTRLVVYSLLQSVYTEPYECYGDSTNITEELRSLNNYVIENCITLLYHDFTGRRNSLLAEHFDKEIGNHLNQVIYGMSSRQDHGCYFDLTDLGTYFPFEVEQQVEQQQQAEQHRPLIKLFNIYNYIVNNKTNLISAHALNYSINDRNMMNTQIEQVITSIKNDLTNHMLSLLRVVFRLKNGDEKREEINVEYCFNFIRKLHREEYLTLYRSDKYGELFDRLIDYFSRDIDILSNLKKLDLTGKELLQFITHGNKPYEWYNNIRHFL